MVGVNHPHSDILNASLSKDKEANASLREEVKRRATGAFKCGDMPSAELLFGKAIEIEPECTMYSNRSMVRLKLGKNEGALKDAEKAIEMDATFVKAHYRKAMALRRLHQYDDAIRACNAMKDVPELAALHKEIEEDKAKAEAENKAFRAEAEDLSIKREEPMPTRMPLPQPKKRATEKPATDKKAADNSMRGYKINEKGQKTSFFHTDISDEAKELIGDIRPKKIEAPVAPAPAEKGLKSSWNTCTFETKCFNSWIADKFAKTFPLKHELHNGAFVFKCSKSGKPDGDLEIAHVRGKPRVINNVSFNFTWTLKNAEGNTIANGELEAENDGNAEYSMEYKLLDAKPEARDIIETYIKPSGGLVQEKVLKKVESMLEDFRNEVATF